MSDAGIVQPIQQPDFAAEVSLGDLAELKLTGSADAGSTAELVRLVGELHAALVAGARREVVVDLRALEFMSAGSFNALVTWLGHVNDLAPEQRYRMRFQSSSNILWQRRSLRTLSCFATDIVAIET
jgi:hypothetical protein